MKGFWEQYIMGAPWMWFSLEIASIDGRVHFYVRTPTRIRDLVETQIYAQYPQAKVIEVDDYTMHVPQYSKEGDWYMWGCEFNKLLNDARPIKTWKNMEDMKSGVKEEVRVDPITPTIEFFGSLSKGQQAWVQIVVRQSIKKYHSHRLGKHVDITEEIKDELERETAIYTRHVKDEIMGTIFTEIRVPDTIKPILTAITDNAYQIHFDCGIRVVVLSNKKLISEEKFNNLRRDVRLIWRQYAATGLNELNRINPTQFDAPWSDPTGLALTKIKKRMLNFYRGRTFFHPPLQYSFKYPPFLSAFFPSGKSEIFVMSNEELATIFHFPGMVSETPSFKRIESKIAKPPSNLPL